MDKNPGSRKNGGVRRPWLGRLAWLGLVLRYGLAVVAVAAALGLREALTAWVGPGLPTYLTFYPAVMAVALLAGFGPGLLATVLAALAAAYWILPPEGFMIASPMERLGLVIFAGMGLFMSVVAELYRRNRDKAAAYDQELALRESEERFRRYFELGLIGMAITSPTKGMVEVNDECCRLLGYERGELLQKTWAELTHPDDLALDVAQFDRVLAGQIDGYTIDKRFVRKDGQVVDTTISVTAMRGAEGAVDYFLALLQDITERKQAEEALRESRKRLERAQEIAHLGSWELDLVSNRLTWSDEVYRIFGLRPQEFGATYEAFLDRVHPEDRAAVDAAYSGSLREGRDTYEIEHRVVRRSTGEIRIVHEKCEHVRDASGRIIRSIGMVHDITEREWAQEALRRSEEKFRTLHALSPLAIVLNRLDNGQFLESNQALWDMTGYTEEEFRSLTYWDITPKEYQEMEARQLELLHTVGRYGPYEKEYIRKDGSRFPVLLSGIRIKDPGGTDLIYSVIQDITELKAKEQALRELNATLEDKVAQRTAELQQRARQLQKLTLEASQTEDRERKRMAEILHDDLQQIIAGAKFHLELLRKRVKYDASLQAIAAQIDGMLKDAIEKSRGLSHELSPVVLHHGDITETLGWLAKQIQAKHGLVVHLHTDGPIVLQSDPLKGFLYKAAQELLFNVVKHARVKEARVRVRRHGPCVCLSVSDRGRGFDPRGLREAVGFGLLSIRERIELLGGRMKIQSVPGRGSTFFIVVPEGLKSEDAVGAYPTSATPDGDGGKEGGHGGPPLRVLLADDHRIVREGLRSLLREEQDVEIVGEAAHGREAVDLALRLKPDVVIMDVAMPLIDGDEATRQIKTHLPQTRVIALSTYNEPETIGKMYQAGAESYVLKTASAEELLAAIRGQDTDGS